MCFVNLALSWEDRAGLLAHPADRFAVRKKSPKVIRVLRLHLS